MSSKKQDTQIPNDNQGGLGTTVLYNIRSNHAASGDELRELWWQYRKYLNSRPAKKLISAPLRTLQRRLRSKEVSRLESSVAYRVSRLFWGDEMIITPPEQVSRAIYCNGCFEQDLTTALVQYLAPGMTFLDIGAHYGYHSLLAARLVGDTGVVHCFEPIPATFQILSLNTRKLEQITAHQKAIYSTNCVLEMRDFGIQNSALNTIFEARTRTGVSLYHKTIKVQAITLDTFVSANECVPDFIKIDAESAETEVLEGMKSVVSELRPMIALEVGDEKRVSGSSLSLIRELADHSYQTLEYREGKFQPHKIKEMYTYANLLFIPT